MAFRAALPLLVQALENNPCSKAVLSVSGGSGVGKTCVSALLTYYLNQLGVGAFTLSGDNYPRRFPELNDAERTRIFGWEVCAAWCGKASTRRNAPPF